MADPITLSVIVVARNEARHIVRCLESIDAQRDGGVAFEVILVDGMSEDGTVELARRHLADRPYPHRIISNPARILAAGWNLGIAAARGRYVVRPDAHAALHPGYFARGLEILASRPDVVAVGGRLRTVATGWIGRAIACALSARTGVGNSPFRTAQTSGYTDTAVFAIYERSVFERVGPFDATLVRHQDNDMHQRIRRSGGRFFTAIGMGADYFCRDRVGTLLTQMYRNGRHLPRIMSRGAASRRHLAPLAFWGLLATLAVGALVTPVSAWALLAVAALYLGAITGEMVWTALRSRRPEPLLGILLIPAMHLAYAAGTLVGLLASRRRQRSGPRRRTTDEPGRGGGP